MLPCKIERLNHFGKTLSVLDEKLEQLLACVPVTEGNLPKNMPSAGIYLFTENNNFLYIGRSKNLRRRYGLHCRVGSQDNQASFAFLLARETTNNTKASYKPDAFSRTNLIKDDCFRAEFENAKKRIRLMNFQFVEEENSTNQALLEIYCATMLGAKYNDFKTS